MRKISVGQPIIDLQESDNVNAVLTTGWLTQGYWVDVFEKEFAKYIGVKHALAVSNGTAALHLALLALGIGPGDEVIVPATTFVATVNAVSYTGATPVIVDVRPDTWCMSPVQVERAITPRTKAVLPVHLYGVPADLGALYEIASPQGIEIVEDAAEALGGMYQGKMLGSIGILGTFSFYGNKTITTGEGGMITTDDDILAAEIRLLRGQGQTPGTRYWHEVIGYNYRMTELQAAIGAAQLNRLPELLRRRAEVVNEYRIRLEPEATLQRVQYGDVHGNWAAAVVTKLFATDLAAKLARYEIETRPVFPPMHALPMYADNRHRPVSEWLHAYGLVLPTHPGLTDDDMDYVCSVVQEALYE